MSCELSVILPAAAAAANLSLSFSFLFLSVVVRDIAAVFSWKDSGEECGYPRSMYVCT